MADPRTYPQPYLYTCSHCSWLNLVYQPHNRVGPQRGYRIEQPRERTWRILGLSGHHDRGHSPTRYAERHNMLHPGSSDVFAARCGRPLIGGPYDTDLYWEEDHHLSTKYCKGWRFEQPRMLKADVVAAIASSGLLGGEDAVLGLAQGACDLRVSDRRYEDVVPVVLPIWVISYIQPKHEPITVGEVRQR